MQKWQKVGGPRQPMLFLPLCSPLAVTYPCLCPPPFLSSRLLTLQVLSSCIGTTGMMIKETASATMPQALFCGLLDHSGFLGTLWECLSVLSFGDFLTIVFLFSLGWVR